MDAINSTYSDSSLQPKRLEHRNIILVGITGCGKTTLAWLLSQQVGFGFIDVDSWIEKSIGVSIADYFKEHSEKDFRAEERKVISSLKGVRNHVISVGGGAILDDESWKMIRSFGTTVWVDCPIAELSRRLLANPSELLKRPLLKDVLEEKDEVIKERILKDRLSILFQQRKDRYSETDLTLRDSYSSLFDGARKLNVLLCNKKIKNENEMDQET